MGKEHGSHHKKEKKGKDKKKKHHKDGTKNDITPKLTYTEDLTTPPVTEQSIQTPSQPFTWTRETPETASERYKEALLDLVGRSGRGR